MRLARLALVCGLLQFQTALAAEPLDDLRQYSPALHRLYRQYPDLHSTLARYAEAQGFRLPYERLATVVHELIHIESAARGAYYVFGQYLRPYIADVEAWPKISNREIAVLAQFPPGFSDTPEGVAVRLYSRDTPDNRLPNVLDEIGAYAQTIGFVAEREPASLEKQARNLRGHLRMAEAYVAVLRSRGADPTPAAAKTLANLLARGRSALAAATDSRHQGTRP